VIAFERRQRILDLLRERSGTKVTELAEVLDVSESTIRNDLNALAEEGYLTRVRGGAVLHEDRPTRSSAFLARAQVNADAKYRITHWAADMVKDGDSILLDASTSVFHMVPFLRSHRGLTIVTNGIEVALSLASDPSLTVILIGGVVHSDNASCVGPLGERVLEDLHIKTAFVSCSGFSVEAGLTEVDLDDAQVKSKMIRSAEHVVALIDSSKFGKTDLAPFATIDQVSHILTDSDLDPRFIKQLRQTNVTLTMCGRDTVSSFAPLDEGTNHYKIGFANISEEQSAFATDVRHGLEQAARDIGFVDLVVADNQLDADMALKMASRLVEEGVDLVIEYQIDESVGALIASTFHQADIPVIAVDIPMVGATFFGVDNYRAGHMAGVALGKWLKENWGGCFDRLIVLEEPKAGPLPASRIRGQLDGLHETVGETPPAKIIRLSQGGPTDAYAAEMIHTLDSLPNEHRLAVISFNDNATIGALDAARNAEREQDIVVVGQGADRRVREEIRRPGTRVIGATAFWPEKYGERLVDIALRVLRGERVPPAVYIDHAFIDTENIAEFYAE
jgi:ribose transport system substrate-binding protein